MTGGAQLQQRIDEFTAHPGTADVAIVYYGHGVEIGGKNYVLGTDADISRPSELQDSLISVDAVIDRVQKVAPVTIARLDACLTNPFRLAPSYSFQE